MAITGKINRSQVAGTISHSRTVEGTPQDIPQLQLTINNLDTSKKELSFDDSRITAGGFLIWDHNLGKKLSALRLTQVSTGEDFDCLWSEVSVNTLRIDFSMIPRPLPGTWNLLIIAL